MLVAWGIHCVLLRVFLLVLHPRPPRHNPQPASDSLVRADAESINKGQEHAHTKQVLVHRPAVHMDTQRKGGGGSLVRVLTQGYAKIHEEK